MLMVRLARLEDAGREVRVVDAIRIVLRLEAERVVDLVGEPAMAR